LREKRRTAGADLRAFILAGKYYKIVVLYLLLGGIPNQTNPAPQIMNANGGNHM